METQYSPLKFAIHPGFDAVGMSRVMQCCVGIDHGGTIQVPFWPSREVVAHAVITR
jgi:hypothetical protein